MVSEFFNRLESARTLRVSVSTVDREIKSGRLRAARIRGRVVISAQALEDYRHALEAGECGKAS
jgi:excisionase family DNA binding protein